MQQALHQADKHSLYKQLSHLVFDLALFPAVDTENVKMQEVQEENKREENPIKLAAESLG